MMTWPGYALILSILAFFVFGGTPWTWWAVGICTLWYGLDVVYWAMTGRLLQDWSP